MREKYQAGPIHIFNIAGKLIPSDMFTKEGKSSQNFQETRVLVMITEEKFDSLENEPSISNALLTMNH